MRKGYSIEKLHYMGGLMPGIAWMVTAPSGHIYTINRYDSNNRDYNYDIAYSDCSDRVPYPLFGECDFDIRTKEDAIKIIYACEANGGFEFDSHGRLGSDAVDFVAKVCDELGI